MIVEAKLPERSKRGRITGHGYECLIESDILDFIKSNYTCAKIVLNDEYSYKSSHNIWQSAYTYLKRHEIHNVRAVQRGKYVYLLKI